MASMAERHWADLRPSAASRYDSEATGAYDRKATTRGGRRRRQRIERRPARCTPRPRPRPTT
jgi:hypothetical protein